MTSPATSILERLCAADSPQSLQDWEKKDAYYIATCRVSKDDVPQLIDVARKWSDPDWPGEDLGLDLDGYESDLLPVTAWRALADLQAAESVEPLIYMLCEFWWRPRTTATTPSVWYMICGVPCQASLMTISRIPRRTCTSLSIRP